MTSLRGASSGAGCGASRGSLPAPDYSLVTKGWENWGKLSNPDPTPATTCVWGRDLKAEDSEEKPNERITGAGVSFRIEVEGMGMGKKKGKEK